MCVSLCLPFLDGRYISQGKSEIIFTLHVWLTAAAVEGLGDRQ